MNMELRQPVRAERVKPTIIDCDIHPKLPNMEVLRPYLSQRWWDYLKTYGTRVRELLESMAARSNGKLTVKVIDPQPFSEEEDRATELGVQGMPLTPGGDKLYLGLAATNSTDGKEAIPFLDPKLDEQLEYDVTKLIHKLATPEKPVVDTKYSTLAPSA